MIIIHGVEHGLISISSRSPWSQSNKKLPVFLLKDMLVATYAQDKGSKKMQLIACECTNKFLLYNELMWQIPLITIRKNFFTLWWHVNLLIFCAFGLKNKWYSLGFKPCSLFASLFLFLLYDHCVSLYLSFALGIWTRVANPNWAVWNQINAKPGLKV